jgi:hypothetical protein
MPLFPEPRASDAESNVIETRAGVGKVEASVAKLANDLSSYRSLEARDGVTVKDRYSSDSYFSVEAGDGGSYCSVEAGDGWSGATGRTANNDGCRTGNFGFHFGLGLGGDQRVFRSFRMGVSEKQEPQSGLSKQI